MDTASRALAEPNRRRILRLTRDRELTAGEIAAQFPVSRPAVSQHLKTLADAGLVSVRRAGTRRYYRTRMDAMDDIRRFLDRFWDDRLEKLKQAAEAEQRRRDGENGEKAT